MFRQLATVSALALMAAGAAHSHDGDDHGDVTLYRVFVGDHAAPRVTVIDLEAHAHAHDDHGHEHAEGEGHDHDHAPVSFETKGQAKLYGVAGGAVVAAVQSDANTVQFFKSGIAFHDHGDHADIELSEPAALETVLTGPDPFHLVDHGGSVIINYDEGGYAEVINGAALTEGKVELVKFPQSQPHHGFVAKLGAHWLSTIGAPPVAEGAEQAPRPGLQEFTAEGAPVGDMATCTAVHGEAFSGAYLAAGCREGVLTATAGEGGVVFKMLDYPADLPQGVTTGTLLGSSGIQVFLGNYGPKGLVVVDPVDAPNFRYIELPFRRVDFVLNPAKPAEGYVLTEDGTLHTVNLLEAKITASAKVTGAYSMDGHWNDPRPRLAVAGDDIVMTDPAAGVLRVISAETLQEEEAIKVEGKPYNLTVVGGSGVQH